ncbi:MAG TPA: quinone-interacting membrane-bound oxidoreductase complex subunit QmoC [Terriglobia bacterium]|nr:quinone-interacting membrane-bound oxidoreductase complex subunit QmoC [Terriglobia bacterium]
MAEPLLIEPDRAFIARLMTSGGDCLKKCFQCANCIAVCELSKENCDFPRKPMIEAQWGLKDKVLAEPGIWLCHDCGDCTANCPRGAKPNQVMEALRAEAIRHYAFPKFMGRLVSNPRFLPLLIVLPFLIFRILTVTVSGEGLSRPFIFAQLCPERVLEPLFFTLAGLVTLSLAIGLARYIKALRAAGVEGKILAGLLPALAEIMTHRKFAQCVTNHRRYWGHLLTLFGFSGLALTGTAVGLATLFGILHTPLPLLSPFKLFANLCAAVILAGVVLLVFERFKTKEKRAATTYFESLFLLILAAAAATGILSEILRLAQTPELMYLTYFIHLNLVFMLFLYAPYSKFVHFLYRTVTLAIARDGQTIAARPVSV